MKKAILGILKKINNFSRKKFHIGIMRNFPYRTSTLFAKERLKARKNLICAEIGTWEGENALDILKNLPKIKKLYLIDPWEEYPKYVKTKKEVNNALTKTLKRLNRYNHKIEIIRKYSEEGIKELPNNMDFIYIDGNHKYEYVKKDVELCYKKLRKGGILAGHDISWWTGVSKAFCEFTTKYKLDPIIRAMDWMVIKK